LVWAETQGGQNWSLMMTAMRFRCGPFYFAERGGEILARGQDRAGAA